jgi:F420-0:gamma-glutamyl ligase-like protein
MARYHALALTTRYWKPEEDYIAQITKVIANKVDTGDYVVVSEKAISVASGKIIDENRVIPGQNAKLITCFGMRIVWGYFLGVLCHFGKRLLQRLRDYPIENGSRHKQLALQQAGLLQAMMFGSEGGIDGSNLPYSLVSLPLDNADELAAEVRKQIMAELQKNVKVLIVDTDKTYSFRNFHFTPRPRPLKGISSRGGVCAYLVGRMLRLKKRPTPLALAGGRLEAEEALKIANVADRARGPGSGTTVWDMAARFKVEATGVTWDMLTKTKHKPIVLVRRTKR